MFKSKKGDKELLKLKRDNVLGLEEEKIDKANLKRFILFLLVFLIVLYFATFGITVSYYKGGSDKPQEIETDQTPSPLPQPEQTISPRPTQSSTPIIDATDKIIFTYSDVNEGGSGINLVNATPISDTQGKLLTGKGNYFDFSVTATSKKTNILYRILLKKDNKSTLSNDDIRIYLTAVSGSYEKELILTSFSNLEKVTISGSEYYVLYQKQLDKGINNYSDFYRLRMWIGENAIDYDNKAFMLKVDVAAEQVGD